MGLNEKIIVTKEIKIYPLLSQLFLKNYLESANFEFIRGTIIDRLLAYIMVWQVSELDCAPIRSKQKSRWSPICASITPWQFLAVEQANQKWWALTIYFTQLQIWIINDSAK